MSKNSKNEKSKDDSPARMKRKDYEEELRKLQVKLCHLQSMSWALSARKAMNAF